MNPVQLLLLASARSAAIHTSVLALGVDEVTSSSPPSALMILSYHFPPNPGRLPRHQSLARRPRARFLVPPEAVRLQWAFRRCRP